MTAQISEPGTMNGYSFKVWFMRNKDTWKLLIMTISGVATYFVTSGNVPQWLNLLLSGLVPVFVKLATDALDFYSTAVKI